MCELEVLQTLTNIHGRADADADRYKTCDAINILPAPAVYFVTRTTVSEHKLWLSCSTHSYLNKFTGLYFECHRVKEMEEGGRGGGSLL